MCNYQTWFNDNSIGYVVECSQCRKIQTGFGNLLVTFSKEDFEKFIEALHESFDKVKELMPDYDFSRPVSPYDDEEKEMSWE